MYSIEEWPPPEWSLPRLGWYVVKDVPGFGKVRASRRIADKDEALELSQALADAEPALIRNQQNELRRLRRSQGPIPDAYDPTSYHPDDVANGNAAEARAENARRVSEDDIDAESARLRDLWAKLDAESGCAR